MQYIMGNPLLLGCRRTKDGYNFSVVCEADSIELLIFGTARAGRAKYAFSLDESFKTGNVFSVHVSGVNLDKCFYCYRVKDKYMVDPYAKAVSGCKEFGVKHDEIHMSPVMLEEYDWEGDKPLNLDYSDSIIYKINVRGFTRSKTSKVKAKGTFAGIIEKLPYLKELGITTLELMPAYEFDEIGRFEQLKDEAVFSKYGVDARYVAKAIDGPVNFWGYVRGLHFAPKAAFSSVAGKKTDYTTEFKDMVKQLHANGIEVVMEMFFDKEETGYILDCVKHWVCEYHIDGVHVYCDEASLNALANEPLLSNTKIYTVFWSGQRGGRKHMGNYNIDFQNVARRFLKGDENMLTDYVNVSKNNPYPAASINYIANNNGFTLYDLVSYDRKHNELNGENNRDGEDFNYSWNCGEEGPTRKRKVKELRLSQIKNALIMVMLSAGTPLIMAGDEFGNSQNGNNNPYCIDSELSWVNWKNNAESNAIYNWTKMLIDYRKNNRILHMPEVLSQSDRLSCGYPDLSYHGSNAWYAQMENYNRHVGMMYSCVYGHEGDRKLIYVAYNMHWENHALALPKLEGDGKWKIIINSTLANACINEEDRTVTLMPRSIAVLEGSYKPAINDKVKKLKAKK